MYHPDPLIDGAVRKLKDPEQAEAARVFLEDNGIEVVCVVARDGDYWLVKLDGQYRAIYPDT